MICTFVGHAEIYKPIETKLCETIEDYLKNAEEAVFYVGGRGEFDCMAAKAVRAAKNRHKEKKIRLYLVEPYMRTELNEEKEYYEEFYDDVIIPPELMGVHPKSAITKRKKDHQFGIKEAPPVGRRFFIRNSHRRGSGCRCRGRS